MSRVFVAEDRALGRQVVVKVLPPELASEVSAARFQREIALAAHLQHPHILTVHAAAAREGLLYYVMPYVAGESLRARLAREGRLPVDVAVRILGEVADALAHAHRRGVVHRDIKPGNVLLQDEHAILADFGVAHAIEEASRGPRLTSTGVGVGTPGYMAPEQLAGERDVDARADVYALGVLGYEMLAGEPPFAGSSARAIVAAQFTRTPKPLTEARPDVPPQVSAAIAKALAREPDARFPSAAEFRDALTASVPPRPRRSRVVSAAWKSALALTVVAVLVLGAAAAGAWLTVRAMFTDDPAVDARAPNIPESLAAEARRAADVPADEPLVYVFAPHSAPRDLLVVTDRRMVRVARGRTRSYARATTVKVALGCDISLSQANRCRLIAAPAGGAPDTLYSGLSPREVTALARVLAREAAPAASAAPAARGP
jgi:serine/threonine-protein kinase